MDILLIVDNSNIDEINIVNNHILTYLYIIKDNYKNIYIQESYPELRKYKLENIYDIKLKQAEILCDKTKNLINFYMNENENDNDKDKDNDKIQNIIFISGTENLKLNNGDDSSDNIIYYNLDSDAFDGIIKNDLFFEMYKKIEYQDKSDDEKESDNIKFLIKESNNSTDMIKLYELYKNYYKNSKFEQKGIYKVILKKIMDNTEKFVNYFDKNNTSEENSVYMLQLAKYNILKNSKLRFKFNLRLLDNRTKTNINIENSMEITETNQSFEIKEDDVFEDSCELFSSILTLSNWYDEVIENSAIGLMIEKNLSQKSIMAYNEIPSITNITFNFMSTQDFISELENDYKNNNKTGNLDLSSISLINDSSFGSINGIIPLYINKIHWKIAKKHIPKLYGIMFTNNPFGYTDKHLNINYYILILYCNDIISNPIEKNIKIFIALQRTCCEITYEKKYNIKKLVNNYVCSTQKGSDYSNMIMIGQILASSCLTSKINNKFNIDGMCKKLINDNVDVFTLFCFVKMFSILRKITKNVGFKNFLESIDKTHSNYDCSNIKKEIGNIYDKIKKNNTYTIYEQDILLESIFGEIKQFD